MMQHANENLLEILLEDCGISTSESRSIQGAEIGELVGMDENAEPLIQYQSNPENIPLGAKTAVNVGKQEIGKKVILVFEKGDPRKPIIIGVLLSSKATSSQDLSIKESVETQPTNVELDGERLTFSAQKEIVFKCGESSITLTKAGKILIRGAYLLSRSSGVNRIQGGSVQIN